MAPARGAVPRARRADLVANAGDDHCACLHLPAALPSVLAVGAMDDDGYPLELASNWGTGCSADRGSWRPASTSREPCREAGRRG